MKKIVQKFMALKHEFQEVCVQILHALKIGLCVKIDQNSISTTEAINLYNDMVDTLINKRGEEEEQEGKKDL